MKKMLKRTLCMLSLLVSAGTTALAAPDIALYDGRSAAEDKLSVAAWGGGSGQESTDSFLFGGHSLKVTTLDLYQGAKLGFATPAPLTGDNRISRLQSAGALPCCIMIPGQFPIPSPVPGSRAETIGAAIWDAVISVPVISVPVISVPVILEVATPARAATLVRAARPLASPAVR